jgi:SAM-dependent methyltransferase
MIEKTVNNFAARRTTCRLCDSKNLVLAMPIKASPIADAFVSADKVNVAQPLIPLDLYQCQDCGHVQNLDIVNPNLLFRDYIFSTSNSANLVEHFKKYADDVSHDFQLTEGALVVEIGSNDGTLLRFFKNKGMRVQGIDPALEIARAATESGIPTRADFFTSELSREIRKEQGPAKLIVANNVYAHADQLADLTDGIASLLDHDGVFVFEVSYLLDIIDKFVFDTVYHEHLSYHSIDPFTRFFKAHDLHLFDVQKISTKGGSFRGFVQNLGGRQVERPIIAQMIEEETRRGLHKLEIFRNYERKILARKEALLAYIAEVRAQGKSVVGYGASTTVTTLMYHFDLFDKLDYLIDDNTKKHGLYSPGCHLEVKPSTALYQDKPDVVIVLAWQYCQPIVKKHAQFIENGGQFVVPLIDLKIIDRN